MLAQQEEKAVQVATYNNKHLLLFSSINPIKYVVRVTDNEDMEVSPK